MRIINTLNLQGDGLFHSRTPISQPQLFCVSVCLSFVYSFTAPSGQSLELCKDMTNLCGFLSLRFNTLGPPTPATLALSNLPFCCLFPLFKTTMLGFSILRERLQDKARPNQWWSMAHNEQSDVKAGREKEMLPGSQECDSFLVLFYSSLEIIAHLGITRTPGHFQGPNNLHCHSSPRRQYFSF